MAVINQTLARQSEWLDGVRAGILALLEFLASEPSHAHLACVDILTAYPHVAEPVEAANATYTQLLSLDLRGDPRAPARADGGEAIGAASSSCCTTTSCAATRASCASSATTSCTSC